MIGFILTVIVIAMVVGLLLWAVSSLPFIPAPMAQIIRVFIVVVACLWLIGTLFGHGSFISLNNPIGRIH